MCQRTSLSKVSTNIINVIISYLLQKVDSRERLKSIVKE